MNTEISMESTTAVMPAMAEATEEKHRSAGPPPLATFPAPADTVAEVVTPLTEAEKSQLAQCEAVLRRGLTTFFEVGSALLTIRESRLYRDTHGTFESYCQDCWLIGRSYAWRVIAAAERLRLLPRENGLPRPANECQMRPFLKLSPEEFPKAWKRVVERAADGKVTPAVIQEIIHEFSPQSSDPAAPVKTPKLASPQWRPPLGQVLMLLFQAKRCVEKDLAKEALAILDRIEDVLFRPEASEETYCNRL